jgi:hypothetical protein
MERLLFGISVTMVLVIFFRLVKFCCWFGGRLVSGCTNQLTEV